MAALVVPGHELKAHTRMLEERQTPASGDALPLADALHLLQSGQLVNVAVDTCGPRTRRGARRTDRVELSTVGAISA